MPIHPLPQFEADLAAHLKEQEDRDAYERLRPPTSVVVRYGVMKLIGEFPYDGHAKPGCGSKLVVRTHRGVELGEMLTSTCPNSGCNKSVSRQEMLDYIDRSGGRDFPFTSEGRVLRLATAEDVSRQSRLDGERLGMVMDARERVGRLGLPMKMIEAEPILGGERITFYYASEDRVDFRELVHELSGHLRTRIELRQVGARDEARLVADYERCGQYCCCKNFLKVLKPVSMKSAKMQKATLDPLKISGRCGRLMCCLRYEDQTYEDLAKRLPRRKARVGTPEGDGIVIDTQILTQLVLVLLDGGEKQVAVTVEELTPPGAGGPVGSPLAPPREPRAIREGSPASDRPPPSGSAPRGEHSRGGRPPERGDKSRPRPAPGDDRERDRRQAPAPLTEPGGDGEATPPPHREHAGPTPPLGPEQGSSAGPSGEENRPRKRRRRRRRRGRGDGGGDLPPAT